MEINNQNINVNVAVNQYIKQKKRVIEYNKQHPEKLKVWQKTYYTNIKANPVKYKAMLDKKREQYKMKKSLNKALTDVQVELE